MKLSIEKMIRMCPGRRHAWYESSVGPIRKPVGFDLAGDETPRSYDHTYHQPKAKPKPGYFLRPRGVPVSVDWNLAETLRKERSQRKPVDVD